MDAEKSFFVCNNYFMKVDVAFRNPMAKLQTLTLVVFRQFLATVPFVRFHLQLRAENLIG